MIGAALAIEREGVWGLSLLVVLPDHQSSGIGRALLERTLEYAGGGRRGAIILASPDHARAARLRARRVRAAPLPGRPGRPNVTEPPPGVRDGDDARPRAHRGASTARSAAPPHGSDIDGVPARRAAAARRPRPRLRGARPRQRPPARRARRGGGRATSLLAAPRRGAPRARTTASSGSPPRSSGRCGPCSTRGSS